MMSTACCSTPEALLYPGLPDHRRAIREDLRLVFEITNHRHEGRRFRADNHPGARPAPHARAVAGDEKIDPGRAVSEGGAASGSAATDPPSARLLGIPQAVATSSDRGNTSISRPQDTGSGFRYLTVWSAATTTTSTRETLSRHLPCRGPANHWPAGKLSWFERRAGGCQAARAAGMFVIAVPVSEPLTYKR